MSVNCAGMASVIELLVDSGFDVNAQRPDGITALMIACRMVCYFAAVMQLCVLFHQITQCFYHRCHDIFTAESENFSVIDITGIFPVLCISLNYVDGDVSLY